MYVIHCDSFFPPLFCREEGGGAGVINFCMKECCTGWIYVGNSALIPSKLYFDTFISVALCTRNQFSVHKMLIQGTVLA